MFSNPAYYFNRELSWLKFNQRVLQEAVDPRNPLLERLKFAAITSSNMDEFFMIRVAGLKHGAETGIHKVDAANMTPSEQLSAIATLAKRIVKIQSKYIRDLLELLKAEGLEFLSTRELTERQLNWLKDYFERNIFPVVTPLAVDSSHPFPFLANRTINTVVRLKPNKKEMDPSLPGAKGDHKIAILPIPSVLDRIIEVPSEKEEVRQFITLEDSIRYFAEQFFLGYEVEEDLTFRVTRDADLEIDEEDAKDLLQEVEKSLQARRRGMVVRLEVEGTTQNSLLNNLMSELQITEDDVYFIDTYLDAKMYFPFSSMDGYDHLRYEDYTPQVPSDFVGVEDSIFDAIRKEDRFIHHPYESFDAVEKFVEEAAMDNNVLAIKQTLYRVSSNSPIIAALMKAADRGKQVTVLMEVKARFDEENNIIMARRLEKSGCHVIYGLVGLKTHSKITMVVRREQDGIRRYVHLATGNYNGSTAKIYTDCGIFTCNDEYGADASAFFNLISGYSDPPVWNKFGVAPLNLRERVVAEIDEEIRQAKMGNKAHMIVKMNSLLDTGIIAKLYEASVSGVKIELIIRGICTLRPQMKGVSENITVRSVVGRFLEHHRLMYFYHGGKEHMFLSSADWMPRNLNDRVELLVPIEEEKHKKRAKEILDYYLRDNVKAHSMQTDGTYRKIYEAELPPFNAQMELSKLAIRNGKKNKLTTIERLQPMYKIEQ